MYVVLRHSQQYDKTRGYAFDTWEKAERFLYNLDGGEFKYARVFEATEMAVKRAIGKPKPLRKEASSP